MLCKYVRSWSSKALQSLETTHYLDESVHESHVFVAAILDLLVKHVTCVEPKPAHVLLRLVHRIIGSGAATCALQNELLTSTTLARLPGFAALLLRDALRACDAGFLTRALNKRILHFFGTYCICQHLKLSSYVGHLLANAFVQCV